MLLYCWHSYSARIGTGLWFAAMNYSVHAIMYAYFGLTQCGPSRYEMAPHLCEGTPPWATTANLEARRDPE